MTKTDQRKRRKAGFEVFSPTGARLRHELIGLSPEAIIELGEEARDFTRLCRALKAVTQ